MACRHSVTVIMSRDKSRAENNSSLGMVCVFKGATQVFAATKLTLTSLITTCMKYTTARVEVSQKPQSWRDVTVPGCPAR